VRCTAPRTTLALLFVATCLCAGGGCSLVDENIRLTYAQPKTSSRPTAQLASAGRNAASNASALSSAPVVEVARPADPAIEKKEKGRSVIGNVRNTYGMVMASVVTADSLPNWFAESYARALTAAGYQAKVVDQLSPGCPRGVELEIRRLFVDQDPGMLTVGSIATLEYRMTLTKNGRKVQQIDWTATGSGDRGLVQTGTTESAVRKAMRASLDRSIPYINAALSTNGATR